MPTDTPATNQIEFIARALILHDSHALMCRNIAANYLYLPGGHIDFAEPASQALKRELLEETTQKITVGPLLLTTENTFHDGKTNHHEINLIFQAQLFHIEQFTQTSHSNPPNPAGGGVGDAASNNSTDSEHGNSGGLPLVESAEKHIEFVWVDLAAVTDLDIRPTQIKAWLASGGQVAAPQSPPKNSPLKNTTSQSCASHLVEFEI